MDTYNYIVLMNKQANETVAKEFCIQFDILFYCVHYYKSYGIKNLRDLRNSHKVHHTLVQKSDKLFKQWHEYFIWTGWSESHVDVAPGKL